MKHAHTNSHYDLSESQNKKFALWNDLATPKNINFLKWNGNVLQGETERRTAQDPSMGNPGKDPPTFFRFTPINFSFCTERT